MNDEKLFSEIDYLGSLEEYLEFAEEHFGLETDEILLELEEKLEKIEPITWEDILATDGIEGVWEEDLAKKKRPQSYPKGTFHLGHHSRGKSIHKDLRIKMNDHLYGWTITDQVEGSITEKIDSLADLRKWKWNDSKFFKFQPDMGDKNVKVVAVKKATQPLVWLNVREVVFPPGSVGASKFEPGVFLTIDEGIAYRGTTKPYFHEWFLKGKRFKGRLIFRLIPVRKKWEKKPKVRLQWQAWLASSSPKGQLPYLLSPRGRSRKDVAPPESESWLPPEWEAKIKSEFRWWPDSKSKQAKIKLIDEAYNDLIERGEIKARKLKLSREIQSSTRKRGFEDFEYLLHHVHIGEDGKEEIHHCFLYDHIANLFEQAHLAVKKGVTYLEGKKIQDGIFHVIKGLESTQEANWSDKEAEENGVKPKVMKKGMTQKDKEKEW